MMWTTAENPVNLTIDFLVDNQFIIPDEANITVRDVNGGVMDQQALSADSTSTLYTFPGTLNIVDPLNTFETRFVEVQFREGPRWHTQRLSFKTIRFLPLTASPQDVRTELGLQFHELPDEEIDLISNYLSLFDEYGLKFQQALYTRPIPANRSIVLKTCLSLVDSLGFRVSTMMKSEDHQIQRMNKFDVSEIRLSLGRKFGDALSTAINRPLPTVPSFVAVIRTDAITGE